MTRIIAPGAAVVAVLFLGVIWWLSQTPASDNQFAQCQATTIAAGEDGIGGPFELVNTNGQTVTDADVITEPTLIYFGYTFCPDVCPFDVARNVDAVDVLAEDGISVTPMFITIDPQRDTPEVLADYAYNMHGRLVALTGSAQQIAAASRAYKTYYRAHDTDEEFYLVDHSTFTYLVLPEHGFVEFYRRDVSPEQMAESVACFVQNA